ncbi:MAG: hypothetical protein QOK16_2360 [Solirubrobacteraceae bacterium]|jgi:hypothetical protein|nr:hypothetical protein [Solirubrobacteraceae bacterium]MEA2187349.1 hypothetical protein [Solirubrobacteraceae bacterium]
MADRSKARPDAPDAPTSTKQMDKAASPQPRQRESAEERREKRTAVARDKQVDLKREAAERRERKRQS